MATLAVFAMTLFIQRSNRRDTLALHAKLDEFLRVDNDARSELTQLDEQEPEAIEKHRQGLIKSDAGNGAEMRDFAALNFRIRISLLPGTNALSWAYFAIIYI